MRQIIVNLVTNDQISDSYNRMRFAFGSKLLLPNPGQFINIRVSNGTSPLLRRPFAISGYDIKSQIAEIIYTRRGPATEILAGKQSGDPLDLIAPLGKPLPELPKGKTAIIVAGGTGLGPMVFLARELARKKRPFIFIFGCRTASMVPFKAFKGLEPVICTDDGSEGYKGFTVAYLRHIEKRIRDGSVIYACGPTPMLKGCHEFAREKGVECWVSLEQVMACGVGACMGCVVKVHGEPGYARVCTEGPVFDSREIVWE